MVRPLKAAMESSTKPDSLSVSVWMATWVSVRSATYTRQWLLRLGLVDSPLHLLYNRFGVILALVHVMLPFMIIPIWTSLQKLDPGVEQAALSLSASRWTAVRRIVLPQVMPGILSGCLIVFGLCASAFAIPGLLGGRRLKMVATVVYDEYLHELNWPLGATLALILLVANLLVMLSYNRVLEGRYKKSMGVA